MTLTAKVGGKYDPHPGSALAEDIKASVCKAALDWDAGSVQHASVEKPSHSSDERPSSRVDKGVGVKKKQRPLVLQSMVGPWQHMPGALSTSCPRHPMM